MDDNNLFISEKVSVKLIVEEAFAEPYVEEKTEALAEAVNPESGSTESELEKTRVSKSESIIESEPTETIESVQIPKGGSDESHK